MKTITERIAKRIRRGQRPHNATILRWAEQYALCRSFGVIPRAT